MTAEEHRKMLDMDFRDAGLEELADINSIRMIGDFPWRRGKGSTLKRYGILTWCVSGI